MLFQWICAWIGDPCYQSAVSICKKVLCGAICRSRTDSKLTMEINAALLETTNTNILRKFIAKRRLADVTFLESVSRRLFTWCLHVTAWNLPFVVVLLRVSCQVGGRKGKILRVRKDRSSGVREGT